MDAQWPGNDQYSGEAAQSSEFRADRHCIEIDHDHRHGCYRRIGRCDAAIAAADLGAGRDAADTAFLDNHKGAITLNQLVVTAVVDGDLPRDSIHELVSIR